MPRSWCGGCTIVSTPLHLPGDHHVFHVRFTDDPQQFWIVIEFGDPSVCLTDPGFDVDVTITADLGSLFQVWLGACH